MGWSMSFAKYVTRLLRLAEIIHTWLQAVTSLDRQRRDRVAGYADEIAATLRRAASALSRLDAKPGDKMAWLEATAELGRITGYTETMVAVLDKHLDGRKLAGVRKRLRHLDGVLCGAPQPSGNQARIEQLLAAEGYFKALADALRV